MKYLVADCETTGLVPKGFNNYLKYYDKFPFIVQLSYMVCNDNGDELDKGDYIIKPDDYRIPKGASDIHGITTEIASEKGIPIKKAFKPFFFAAKDCDKLIGHNLYFDFSIIKANILKLGLSLDLINPILNKDKRVDTMRSTTNYCKLPGMYGYKFPKLEELYKILFGKEMEGAHNAMQDVIATKECYFELLRRKIL